MSSPAPIDVALQRRRLIAMLAFDGLCVVVAVAAAIGYLSFHVVWLGLVFAGAIVAGFAAQVWLMLGLRRRS